MDLGHQRWEGSWYGHQPHTTPRSNQNHSRQEDMRADIMWRHYGGVGAQQAGWKLSSKSGPFGRTRCKRWKRRCGRSGRTGRKEPMQFVYDTCHTWLQESFIIYYKHRLSTTLHFPTEIIYTTFLFLNARNTKKYKHQPYQPLHPLSTCQFPIRLIIPPYQTLSLNLPPLTICHKTHFLTPTQLQKARQHPQQPIYLFYLQLMQRTPPIGWLTCHI